MQRDRRFRRQFGLHAALAGFIVVGMLTAAVIVWSPWDTDNNGTVPGLATPPAAGTPEPTPGQQ